MGDMTKAKAADLVLVTDEHDDHYNPGRIAKVRKPGAPVVVPPAVQARAAGAIAGPLEVLVNDQRKTIAGIVIEAVAMYNVQSKFGDEPFHTKGRGNGYVITVGGKRLYLAGDTECVPEIKALQNIDVAFLPMNLPFTMPPSEADDCARAFKPKIAIPYHFQGQNTKEFADALKGSGIEVRELDWYPAVNYADVVAVQRPGKLVDVGGRKLHVNCTGSGQPTVILEGGAPSFAIDWFFVQPDIAKTNRVCSYDRAGSGWSEPSGHLETVDGAVADLHAALRFAGEKSPYILVGAGIGAFFVRAYQLLYPEDIAGLVLADGAHEDGFLIPVDGQPAPIWSVSAQQLRSAWELMRPPKDMPPPPMPPPQTDAPFDKLPLDLLTTRVTFESRLLKAMAATDPDQFLDVLERQRAALARLHEASFKSQPPLGNRPLIVLTAE
jgi:L-ascorbate metabolism protein UlaG (beta-lactamase superfamily)/pimeloyl-ACP methyl ester carboxylesterase